MIQTFTQDDIIRYVYAETTSSENQQIEESLAEDADLLEFYLGLIDLQMGLNRIETSLSPRKSSINAILAYSQSTNPNYSMVN